ncbi:hypothetical protein H7F15_12250 [Pontibacter sp. Tf4]|uniref:hypothetical protein n=1 Tax=Pontibacter sp. Tf4 TaxID=2761620 RepID=UPI0016247D23|nr:hypothetical protein [Pontibacter sp. Tf4]MBB6611813.1 hypothetical protein [Pontibacter sp. Tf4]
MKTRYLLLPLFLLLTLPVNGQTFDEWFRQKRTKEKYLVQQIAALQAYSGTLRQGIALAHEGISTVRNIKNGDLGLHQVFFRSLREVNPRLKRAPLVRDILDRQAAIIRAFGTHGLLPAQQEFLTTAERAYLQQVKANVLQRCRMDLDELWLLLTDDRLEMTDGSRLRQLQALLARSATTYAFTNSFLEQVRRLARDRAMETHHLQKMRNLYPTR